ncbi:MAG: hypothetical protein C0524_07840 [Rhodobacter sp.]|nr:hypothetical protein [Rhodobacter sp.]
MVSAGEGGMQTDWQAARNHYLAMAALAVTLGGMVALFDPGVASAIALPAAFLAAVTAGAKFAALAGRAMQRGEALRLAGIASALQVGVGVVGMGLAIMAEQQQIVTIHSGTILAILAAAAGISFLVTLAGLRFGAIAELRRLARQKRPD